MSDPLTNPSDPLTPLYILVGTGVVAQLAAGIVGFVKWLGARTVAREDKDKDKTEKRLEENDERFDELEESIRKVDRSVELVQASMHKDSSTLDSIRGMVGEVKSAMDNRLEKQAEFYRAQVKELTATFQKQMEDLEYKIRQDMTRSIHDASQIMAKKRTKS